jgi:hypothetical protein
MCKQTCVQCNTCGGIMCKQSFVMKTGGGGGGIGGFGVGVEIDNKIGLKINRV